jgi:glycosyltransferase involved in cell wall biosynthesis
MPSVNRVLHVSVPTVAGVATALLGYVTDQVERGWTVTVACPPDGWLAAATTSVGAQVLPWPATREPGPGIVQETVRLSRLVASANPDVVHLHSAKAGLAGRLALRGRRPTVFQPHAWSFLAATGVIRAASVRWERFAARWTDGLVCVSDGEKAAGLAHGVHARTWVIPNGVDCAEWTPATGEDRAAARSRHGLPDRPLVVCIGRLCTQKGQSDLLDAWDAVRRAVPEAGLVLVGDGPDRAPLQTRADRMPGVLLAGERVDVADWLAAANVVVVPSRWDGMALVVLEAMARARSIVATDVAGVLETVPREAGAVVAVGDRTALARELVVRLRDGGRADAEGAAGRHSVETAETKTAAAAAIVRAYQDVLGTRRPSRSLNAFAATSTARSEG